MAGARLEWARQGDGQGRRPAPNASPAWAPTLKGAMANPELNIATRLWLQRFPAETLSVPGRASCLALHAAHHGVGWGGLLADLERAALDGRHRDLGGLGRAGRFHCRRCPHSPAVIRLTEPGGMPGFAARPSYGHQSVRVAPTATTPPPIALGFDQLESESGWAPGASRHPPLQVLSAGHLHALLVLGTRAAGPVGAAPRVRAALAMADAVRPRRASLRHGLARRKSVQQAATAAL